jgi:hypothetical protein
MYAYDDEQCPVRGPGLNHIIGDDGHCPHCSRTCRKACERPQPYSAERPNPSLSAEQPNPSLFQAWLGEAKEREGIPVEPKCITGQGAEGRVAALGRGPVDERFERRLVFFAGYLRERGLRSEAEDAGLTPSEPTPADGVA